MFSRERLNKLFKKSFGDNIRDWLEVAKTHKMIWVNNTDRGDMPPTVIVERNGRVLCAIIAKNIDKAEGLHVAHMARSGMCADKLTLLFDAHMKIDPSEEALKGYKPGEFQRMCEEEGALEKDIITDCILMHRISDDGEMKFMTLPYKIVQGELQWRNDEKFSEIESQEFSGFIPDNLRKIMDTPQSLDQMGDLLMQNQKNKDLVEEFVNMDFDQKFYYIYRVVSRLIKDQGYVVMDYTGWGYMGDDAQQAIVHLREVSKDDDNVTGFALMQEDGNDFVAMFFNDTQNSLNYPNEFLGVSIKKLCDPKVACTTFADNFVSNIPGAVAVTAGSNEIKIILYVKNLMAARGKFPPVWKDYPVELKLAEDAHQDILRQAKSAEAIDSLLDQFPDK